MIKSELVRRNTEQNPHVYRRDVENIVNTMLGEIVAVSPFRPCMQGGYAPPRSI